MKPKIIVVDDDNEIRELLQEYLNKNGFETETAESGHVLFKKLEYFPADIIILDIMMPGDDGFEVCRQLRRGRDTPVIMLTALDEDTDKIVGLELGADDYLSKPFNPRELLARIKGILRRVSNNETSQTPKSSSYIIFDDWKVDPHKRVLISPDNETVPVSSAEYRLLNIFLQNPNRVLNRDQLMDWIAGRESTPFDRSIDVQISRLRQKLETHGSGAHLIKTIRGEGYFFTAQVSKT